MKKIYLSFLGLLAGASLYATQVTFSVDMTGQTVNPAGVHIAGSFQSEAGASGDWIPNATQLTDQGGGIWSITVDIPAGYYEYKFVNGSQWGSDESPAIKCNVNGNRAVSVGSSALVIPTPLFGQCAGTDVTVLFRVDMRGQSFINPNGIHVAGNFQSEAGYPNDWEPGTARLFDNGDSIYLLAARLPAGSYEYKFINGNQWGDDETVPAACATNNNRGFSLDGTQALALPAVVFSQCPPGVIFRVDMTDETVGSGVFVAGSFNNWDATATPMTLTTNNIYEATVQVSPGSYEYKFVNGSTFETVPSACANGSGNRTVSVTGGTSIPAIKFGKCRPRITLTVDMSNETVSADSVHVAGAFQGWSPGTTQLTHIGNNLYTVTIEADAGTYQYKFINGNAWGADESVPAACNVGGNREIVVGTTDLVAPTVCFKQCSQTCVLNPAAADITFRVAMDDPNNPVDASGLWIMGSFTSPTWQNGRVQLTDADNDSIYEVTINVSGPAEIQYKFSNGEPVPGSSFQDGETGDFAAGGCGVSNGIGGFNRVHVRTGQPEVLNIVSYNSCTRLSTGLESAVQFYTRVFPNPAQGVVNVDYNPGYNTGFSVAVIDLSGRVVNTSSREQNGNLAVSLSGIRAGAYLIRVTDLKTGESGFQKLIVH